MAETVRIVHTFHADTAKQGTEEDVSASLARTLVRHGRARYVDAAPRAAADEPRSAGDQVPAPLVEETSGKTRRRAAGAGDAATDR